MLLKFLKEIGKHSFIYSIGLIASSLASILLLPVYTRFLSKADYGVLSLADHSIALVKIVFLLGGAATVTRFFHYFDSEIDRKKVISTGFWLTFFSSGLAALILTIGSRPLAGVILGNSSLHSVINLAAIILFAESLSAVMVSYFAAAKKSKAYISYSLVRLGVGIGANLYFIVALRLGVLGMMYGQAISSGLLCVLTTVHVLLRNGLGFDRKKLKPMLKYGLPLVPAMLLASLMHYADQYLLRYYIGLESVGIYALGYKIPFAVNGIFLTSLNLVWGSAMIYEIHKQPDAKYLFSKITTYLVSLYILLMFGISVFSEYIIRILAAEPYYEAHRVIPLVCLGLVPYVLHAFLSVGVTILNKTWLLPVSSGIAAAVNILINIFLIPKFGYMGAAWATVISYGIFALSSWLLYRKVYSIPFEWGRLGFLLGLCVGLYFLAVYIPISNIFWRIAYQLSICLSLPLLLYSCGFLKKEEKEKLKEWQLLLKRKISFRPVCR